MLSLISCSENSNQRVYELGHLNNVKVCPLNCFFPSDAADQIIVDFNQ